MKRTMMLNINRTLFIFLIALFCSTSYAQSEGLRGFKFNLPNEVIDLQLNDLELSNPDKLFFFSTFINDTTSLWIRTNLQLSKLSGYFSSNQNNTVNILSPLYQDYENSQSLRTLKSILGSVSFGATAYLAYKHLKKYGFLKKK